MPSEPTPQPRRLKLRGYNKLDGLRVLERSLEGVEGARVLPFRVYRKPEEFSLAHFEGPPEKRKGFARLKFWTRGVPSLPDRLLIRMNIEGPMSEGEWTGLPREDAKPQEALTAISGLLSRWKHVHPHRPETGDGSAHFIVHPTRKREDYEIFGKVNLRMEAFGKAAGHRGVHQVFVFSFQHTGTDNVWRTHYGNPELRIPASDFTRDPARWTNELAGAISRVLPKERAQPVTENLVRAIKKIHAGVQASKISGNPVLAYETSFSVAKGDNTLEFYDLIKPSLKHS